jgi:hypothetical protein
VNPKPIHPEKRHAGETYRKKRGGEGCMKMEAEIGVSCHSLRKSASIEIGSMTFVPYPSYPNQKMLKSLIWRSI